MNVLMITGDKRFGSGNPRYDLQASAVGKLEVLYWGRGQLFPRIPHGHFDVVTAQDPLFRGVVAWCISKKLRAKLNVQVHMDLSTLSLIRRILAQIIIRHADSVRVVSDKIKVQVEKIGFKGKISVLPVFVDIERFKKLMHQPQRNKKTIVWIGRFEEEKDPEEALSVFNSVREAGIDASLVVLGKGSLEEKLLRLKSAYNLEYRDEIEFPGWRDPYEYLKMADVVLCTSWYESWGASIVESLAAGVPVVSPDVGVAKEAGAIVVPREKLAEKVIEVLKNGEKGVLKLSLLPASEWAVQWKQTLV